jgi:hypothetical protein
MTTYWGFRRALALASPGELADSPKKKSAPWGAPGLFRLKLSDDEQRCAFGDAVAALEADGFDFAVAGGDEGVFHFHGFEDDDGFALGDFVADVLQVADDETGHGGGELGAIRSVPALLRFGVPELNAHMFVFYFGAMSAFMPPGLPAPIRIKLSPCSPWLNLGG